MDKVAGNNKKTKIKSARSNPKVKSKAGSATKLSSSKVRDSIIRALSHTEAEDGLYFRNFFLLHEEDQRPSVRASTKDILASLNQLLEEGKVRVDYDELEVTFRLAS